MNILDDMGVSTFSGKFYSGSEPIFYACRRDSGADFSKIGSFGWLDHGDPSMLSIQTIEPSVKTA